MLNGILTATIALGGLGLLFGIVLTITSKVFAVPGNPLRDALREALPGANCGGCGYPGCDALAEALAAGKAPIDACPVGGPDVIQKIAKIMGTEATDTGKERQVAQVICQGGLDRCKSKFNYKGIQDCVAATLVSDGNKACHYACLGLGTCARACKFDAIHMDEQRKIAVIDPEKCTSCGACIDVCPKHVLAMQPEKLPVRLLCRAAEQGKLVADNCKAGCIGCEICYKECKFDAIVMKNHLPQIDREKCVGCMMCAESCPTSAIWGDFDNRMIAEINKAECIGCTICKKTCQFEAISGERKQPHEITEACTGCGECVAKCPKKCITLHVREHVRDEFAKVGTTPYVAAVPGQQA